MDPIAVNETLLKRSLERGSRLLEADDQLQRTSPSRDAIDLLRRESGSSIELVALACRLYADRPCFGRRAIEVSPRLDTADTADSAARALPAFDTMTYADLWTRVEAFASGLRHGGLADTGDLVGICGFSSPDWVVSDLSCLYLAAVSVPLQTTASSAELSHILGEAELRCVVCSAEQLDKIASALPRCPSLRSLVVMGGKPDDQAGIEAVERKARELQREHGPSILVRAMRDVELLGRERGTAPVVLPSARGEGAPDPLMTLMYTSGSTGAPKGAMFPESVWRQLWRSTLESVLSELPYVGVGFMPLNHGAGRTEIMRSILLGGVTCFVSKSDMSSLFDDIRLARPTVLAIVPRVSSMIHQHFQTELVKRAPSAALGDARARRAFESDIMEEMRRSFLGDRLLVMTTTTAPTSPEILTFLRRCFDVPVLDGYGSTECGVMTRDGRVSRAAVTDFRVTDAPEIGYRTTDTPYPRGELRVRSRLQVSGYYKNPEATAGLFDEDGYVITGDIVEQRGPDHLVWIDRRKTAIKLAQGEFVSLPRLEALYSASSPFIQQVYVDGSSLRSYLLAVVVPEVRAAAAHLEQRGLSANDASEPALRQLIRGELNRVAADEGLQGYEIPRDFILELDPFTVEAGLLTESNKPCRPRMAAKYGAELARLHAEIEGRQLEELHALEEQRRSASSVEERVKTAVAATLGTSDVDLSAQSFVRLGGDSLSAARLAALLTDVCGVAVPVGVVLDPTSSVRALVQYVERALEGRAAGGHVNVTFEQVHGVGAQVLRADDLRLDRFLAPEEIAAASRAAPATALPPEAEVVCLTGANGFLGRFLLLELLELLPVGRGKVYCVVRAPDASVAARRLREAFEGSDPALLDRFDALSAHGRLEVLAGDLMKPRFGLPDAQYDRLCDEVDTLVHNAALVNHAFSYAQLFEPNVLGTVEAIRMALRWRKKAVSFISSVSVAGDMERAGPILEEEDGRALWSERPVDGGYAAGYGTSKWACEVLLRDASEQHGIPVMVFRCSMIMAHSEYQGQVNTTDFLTRLLCGIVSTGLAPRSFYASAASGEGGAPGSHFDGMPVDFVARAIAAVTAHREAGRAPQPRASYETYHVVNPHWDDGVSLDSFVGWAQSMGYPIARVEEHAAWYRMFSERLQALGEEQRQHSPLPILHQWERPLRVEAQLRFDAQRLARRLAELAHARDGRLAGIPGVNEAFFRRYLKDVARLGLISDREG
ncbi:thioester reductase domain-containing protein [Sorangium sp. So ce321]|uniref:thioester reductase domain-containing protein n=1 Tax=Sorangium sp. So ce321 TaxID=3133300 RepID=UPI003F61AB66